MASKTALRIIRCARAGDAMSQFQLGSLYLDGGEGLPANMRSALLWLEKAADQGCAQAWRLIGQRIPAEFADRMPKLVRWYELAAHDGCAPAQAKLARLLLSEAPARCDAGTAQTAIGWLRSAAAQGDVSAQAELGSRLLESRNGQDMDEAAAWLERAHAAGQTPAARALADHYWRTGNTELARLWYSRCLDLRDAELCYRFGLLCALLGESGEEYLERAAAAGHPLACEELGLRYALGWRGSRLSTRDFKKAVRWLERAALFGSAKACFFLALLYDHYNCSFRSRGRAREWLLEAATRGHPEAQYRAGVKLLRDADSASASGRFDEPDVAAIRFLADAARQGNAQAARVLDEAGCRAPVFTKTMAAEWVGAVAAMAPLSLPVAMRIELAGALGLRVVEMILVDPVEAHRGDCFVVDPRRWGIRSRRRVVLTEHPAQREVVERARSLFAVSQQLPGDLFGDYHTRYGKFWRLCARAGIDIRLFRQDAAVSAPGPAPAATA